MNEKYLLIGIFLLLFGVPAVFGLDSDKISPPPDSPEGTPKSCDSAADCGEMAVYSSACNAMVIVWRCEENNCMSSLHPVKSALDSGLAQARQAGDGYLAEEFGADYAARHFQFVEARAAMLEEPVDVELSEVSSGPSIGGCSALTIEIIYEAFWDSAEGERYSLPFGMNWNIYSEFEDSIQAPDMDKIEDVISQSEAEQIAGNAGVSGPFSYFEFGSSAKREGEAEKFVPAWAIKRELTQAESACQDYKVGVVIDAFSGGIIREFTDNPCLIKAGDGKGGLVSPLLPVDITIALIAAGTIIVIAAFYLAKRRK